MLSRAGWALAAACSPSSRPAAQQLLQPKRSLVLCASSHSHRSLVAPPCMAGPQAERCPRMVVPPQVPPARPAGPGRRCTAGAAQVHLGYRPHDPSINVHDVAFDARGFTGAQLGSLVNTAAGLAGRLGRTQITQADLRKVRHSLGLQSPGSHVRDLQSGGLGTAVCDACSWSAVCQVCAMRIEGSRPSCTGRVLAGSAAGCCPVSLLARRTHSRQPSPWAMGQPDLTGAKRERGIWPRVTSVILHGYRVPHNCPRNAGAPMPAHVCSAWPLPGLALPSWGMHKFWPHG